MLLKGCGWLSRALGLAAVSLKRRDSSNRKPNRRGLIRTQRTQPNRQRPSWHSTARIVAGATGFSAVGTITRRPAHDPGDRHPHRARVASPLRPRYCESGQPSLMHGVLSATWCRGGTDPAAAPGQGRSVLLSGRYDAQGSRANHRHPARPGPARSADRDHRRTGAWGPVRFAWG